MDMNAEWIARQEKSEEARRTYERERLKLWTTEAICDLLEERNLSKADVARKLGTSRANVTQTLSGNRNCTLDSLADLAWACGQRMVVRFEPLRAGEFISTPMHVVQNNVRILPMSLEPQVAAGGLVEYPMVGAMAA